MKRTLTIFLALILISGFSACGNESDPEIKSENQSDIQTETSVTEETAETEYHYYEHIAQKDLEGMEFRIISRITDQGHDAQHHTDYGNNEIDASELDGSQINDVVYNRNRELEQRYNFTFKSIQIDSNPFNTIKKSVLAASDDYDVVVDSIGPMADYTMFTRLDGLSDLDLSADCWDQNVNTSLSIINRHYIAVGDMLILDKKGTWCQLFNKKLANDLQLENLYDTVRDGKWTIDKFYSLIQLGARDLNGDGKMDESDSWGFLSEDYNMNILMFGGGVRYSIKDEEDRPVISPLNDRSISLFEKAIKVLDDRSITLSMGWSKNGPADCLKAFAEDRGLFYMTGIGTAMEFRYMESDFGIIPIAKYDETQEKYLTSFSKSNSAALAIPKSCANPDNAGFIVQAISLSSTDTLQKTFKDIVLTGITTRDEESRDMLDILFDGRVFDLAFINGWGGIDSLYRGQLGKKSPDIVSAYAKIENKVNEKINIAVELYSGME